jgi:hypothetical protein
MGMGDVAGGISAFVGDIFGGDPLRKEASNAWRNLTPDDVNTLLAQYQTGGNAYDGIRSDPLYDEASKGAMMDLIRRGQSPRLDMQAQSQLREGGNQMRARNQMAQGAIGQQAMATGSYGGGADLMNKMMAQQGAYEQAGNFGAQAAGGSEQRANQNTQTGMAGAFEGSKQDWAAKAAKAEAANRIGMFNAQARRGSYQDNWNQRLAKTQGMTGQLMNEQQYPGRVAAAGGQALGGFMDFAMGSAGGMGK